MFNLTFPPQFKFPRITTLFKIGGTETWRLSSEALWEMWGGNLQNWEKWLRVVIKADEGYDIVQVDQAGAEALIVAYLCRNARYRSLFLNKIKPHCYIGLAFPEVWESVCPTVRELAKLEPPELKVHPEWPPLNTAIAKSDKNAGPTRYYYHYKQTCHSGNYGIKAPTFRMNMLDKSEGKVVLSLEQAKNYLNGYRTLFPELLEWHMETDFILKKTRTLYNLFGFPREFEPPFEAGNNKDAYAFVPQSTVGCITHTAYIRMQNYIEDNHRDWHLINNCHDSYTCLAPEGDEALECAAKMTEFMNQTLRSPRGEEFQMRSECQIGKNWGPYDKERNPLGLKEIRL